MKVAKEFPDACGLCAIAAGVAVPAKPTLAKQALGTSIREIPPASTLATAATVPATMPPSVAAGQATGVAATHVSAAALQAAAPTPAVADSSRGRSHARSLWAPAVGVVALVALVLAMLYAHIVAPRRADAQGDGVDDTAWAGAGKPLAQGLLDPAVECEVEYHAF